ncbi:type IV pili twitching motility protein PilT [Candidatus Daviesbacteria bacterium RIFCSPHIGHO2_01_FULL_44_29]|uniref:Type IV pili twitching motility protein PilT n=1 Tax=Candidatus Daviesbacteria bacterium RIFCSPHIGHO2_02_FULL_43_12 TaxID=1797776 RepID=A0A1F5KFX2_9BACT|nr:MAG: type IV pili twitching motility protein PilT [Candidatus Daviesbacteria bacterium RIFCSPHIGHO2_01_FULL_44_29]OGE38811.1 MAG: type IV pili twitching motility protein PilT [Candidatus Daviesbacteria bacterium RIFCSPHIGHO2_12_FULL_47_45]OGE39710.1 MAG: type IV pili twitching motility protein PilT [Candidatus Daviesbacteria bacterium RIFCSPHIGHO2_02_FULL_43_12]OGE70001.1 MAG: type IV pili twitching motility protein PilT [Candidatus Daviesbacteria bacterium RIFCSPLOWO2_01_FULL_43_15]
MNIYQLLQIIVDRNASDLHLLAGFKPQLRLNGELISIEGSTPLGASDVDVLVDPLLTPYQKKLFQEKLELDLGFEFNAQGRFRINLYRQKGTTAAAFRLIPKKIRDIHEIGLPDSVMHLTDLKQGLVLVTGPTGHGKSTTLAAFINQINMSKSVHVLTVEDPIEYVYPPGKALISQREINFDTQSWSNSLKYALREDPDVVLIGEMRDLETISSAMTIAETGHLVFATVHTNSAAQTVDRIIDVFPENQQPQIRTQLASVIEAIISLRLIPTISPGRVIASEILYGVPALRSIIRDGKTHLVDNLIQTSGEYGMRSLEVSLAELVRAGKIDITVAKNFSIRPQVLSKLLGRAI